MTTRWTGAGGTPTTGRAGGMWFEDFAVGQRFHSGERLVTERDLRALSEVSGDVHRRHSENSENDAPATRFGQVVVHEHFGLVAVFGLFDELGLVDESLVGLRDTHWRYLLPVHIGDVLRFEMAITRCRRSRGGDQGVVNHHMALLNQHDQRVQEGTVAVLLRARRPGGDDPVGHAFGTVAWGQALARRLDSDGRFTAATGSWDGTLGLRCGDDEVHLRIYRGRVLEATRRTPHGATFTLVAGELSWTELLTGPRNDFLWRAMNHEFEARGSGYEYLRLTKAVTALVDCARELATQGAGA